jgi:hypothetical protein
LQRINGKQVIIATVSKTLSETEQRWSASERECWAIVFSIERLAYFLKGPNPFILCNDHRSLTFMDKSVFENTKISRWQERIKGFYFCLQHIEGEKNI